MSKEIEIMLDHLAGLRSAEAAIKMRFDELRNSILTPEIRAQLAEIDAEQQTAIEAATSGLAKLTDEIKAAVIANGASVKGANLQAVYTSGRVTWDTKAISSAIERIHGRSEGLYKSIHDAIKGDNEDVKIFALGIFELIEGLRQASIDAEEARKVSEPSISIREVK